MPGASRESILAPFGSAWLLFWLHFGYPWRPFGLFGSVPAEGSRKWMRLSVLVRDWSVLGPAWGVLGVHFGFLRRPLGSILAPFGSHFSYILEVWKCINLWSAFIDVFGTLLGSILVPFWGRFSMPKWCKNQKKQPFLGCDFERILGPRMYL